MVNILMNYLLHKPTLHNFGLIKSGLLCSGLLFLSQSAFADATIVYELTSGMQKTSNMMQIKDGKIRFTPPNKQNNYSLYDSQTNTLTHVDSGQRKYLSMDEKMMTEQANKVQQQMDKMRQDMVAKMKDMPPEQKKQVEQMMNNHLSRVEENKIPHQIEQKKTSRTETIAGIQCSVHESYVSGIKVNEICMTESDKMGLSTQDANALMSMQEFMKRMQKVAQKMMGSNVPTADLQGVPLHTILFAPDGSVKMETRLASVSTSAISSDKVTLPADYTAIPMPQMPATPGAQ